MGETCLKRKNNKSHTNNKVFFWWKLWVWWKEVHSSAAATALKSSPIWSPLLCWRLVHIPSQKNSVYIFLKREENRQILSVSSVKTISSHLSSDELHHSFTESTGWIINKLQIIRINILHWIQIIYVFFNSIWNIVCLKIQKEEKQGIFHDQHTWPRSAEALPIQLSFQPSKACFRLCTGQTGQRLYLLLVIQPSTISDTWNAVLRCQYSVLQSFQQLTEKLLFLLLVARRP